MAGTDDILIRMEKVEKYYGNFHALRDVNLTVRRGEKIVLCGPSGSGKSTLIRCINHLEAIRSGRIVVDGTELTDNPQAIDTIRREVGMVFQQFNLFPHMTVLENCMLAPLRVRKVSRTEAEATARKYLDRVRIGNQAEKYPAQLSGGQQQRVAIARALAMDPKLILFDEPTSALDPELSRDVSVIINKLYLEDVTMLCVTHDAHFAKYVCDKILFLDQGVILTEQLPETLYAQTKDERIRRFFQMAQDT